jgi:hypothetical protein
MPCKGYKQTEEHRKKRSESFRIQHPPKDPPEKRGHPSKNPEIREDWIRNISNSKRGKPSKLIGKNNPNFGGKYCTPEWREKMSKSKKGKIPWNKGRTGIFTEETLEKLSKSRKGKPTWNKGKTGVYTKEALERMSTAHIGFVPGIDWREKQRIAHLGKPPWNKGKDCPQLCGENNPAWMGGISFEPYSPHFNKLFKRQIRLSYGNRCVYPGCGVSPVENGRELDVHHYDYDKKSIRCVPLCRKHNVRVNKNREYWEKYFTSYVLEYVKMGEHTNEPIPERAA